MSDGIIIWSLFAILMALCSGIMVYLLMQRRYNELDKINTALNFELRTAQERVSAIEQGREELSNSFEALSSKALRNNNQEFLRLAQENLKQFQIKAQGDLDQKEKTFESLVNPIKQALEKTEQQIRQTELERKESYGSLTKHLEGMAQTQLLLQGETRNLVQALRRPEVRGQWGELTLKRLAELAGMVEYCDFYEQEHTATGEGSIRPDMVVRMSGGREIVIDVKTPLDAYLSAIEAVDDTSRKLHLSHHARKVSQRVTELASKAYWNQFKSAPDFVVLFIPGDQFLSAALDIKRDLIETALQQKVILATPSSFVALLHVVAYGWRQQSVALNAEKIRDLGNDMYKRLMIFTEHLSRVGKGLNSSVEHYNSAVGSFEGKLMPGARKFVEMGIQANKPIEILEPIDKSVRALITETEKIIEKKDLE
jgi:DNA recombination protein RmuC